MSKLTNLIQVALQYLHFVFSKGISVSHCKIHCTSTSITYYTVTDIKENTELLKMLIHKMCHEKFCQDTAKVMLLIC